MGKPNIHAHIIDEDRQSTAYTLEVTSDDEMIGEVDVLLTGKDHDTACVVGVSEHEPINNGSFLPGCIAVAACFWAEKALPIQELRDLDDKPIDLRISY